MLNNIRSLTRLFFLLLRRKTITPLRLFNFCQVGFSYIFKTTKVYGVPPALMIEPTAACNLKCPVCPTGNGTLTRNVGQMRLDQFKNIIDEIGDRIFHITLWGYGEPYIARDINEMVAYAKTKNIFVRTSTNGHFFTTQEEVEAVVDSGLDNLIVALDGATQESLVKYRIGADFDEIVAGMKAIVQAKKDRGVDFPFVELQYIVMDHNEHEIPAARELAKEIGVDRLTLKSTLRLNDDLQNERFGRGLKENKVCSRVWFSTVINWDGTINPCCYDANGHFTFGRVNADTNTTFKDVWNGESFVSFREKSKRDKNSIDMCRGCHGSFATLNVE